MSEMIVTLDQLRAAREFAEKVTPLRLRLYQNRRKDSPAPRELDPIKVSEDIRVSKVSEFAAMSWLNERYGDGDCDGPDLKIYENPTWRHDLLSRHLGRVNVKFTYRGAMHRNGWSVQNEDKKQCDYWMFLEEISPSWFDIRYVVDNNTAASLSGHPRHDGVRNKKVLYPTDFPPETRR